MNARGPSTPQRVGALLTRAVPALAGHLLEETIRRDWALVVGPELARRSRPGALQRGVLDVCADNSPWLTELTMRSGEILAALEARYGPAVTAVRCTLGPVSRRTEDRRRRPRAAAPSPLTLEPGEAREIEAALAPVRDPEVAGALRRLLTRDRLARRRPGAEPAQEGPAS